MSITIVEEAGLMEMGGKEAGIGAAVGAEPIGEATEGVGLVDLPVLMRGLENFRDFRTTVQAREATRTPLA